MKEPIVVSREYPSTRAGIRQFVADVEAVSPNRAFRAADWPLIDADLRVAEYGWLQGVGCEYRFYALIDGTILTTIQADGPWPHACVEWVEAEPMPYAEAVTRVMIKTGEDVDERLLTITQIEKAVRDSNAEYEASVNVVNDSPGREE